MLRGNIGSFEPGVDRGGIIFDIQKYSLHDGPGIRTIVFFKGCPLVCSWCSNPESQSAVPELMWNGKKCRRCGKCISLCPNGSLSFSEKYDIVFNRDKCTGCGLCDKNCYADGIQLKGRYVSVDEVMAEVEKDRVFYEQSGGGLTLGGGEPLLQPDFASSLLKSAKERDINTVVETASYVAWRNIEAVLPWVDLFLCDIKHMNRDIHKIYTGVYNDLILKNVEKTAVKKDVLIRVPVIPKVNDDEENILATARYAAKIKAVGIELLPFHKMGLSKYENLQRRYDYADTDTIEEEKVNRLKAIAKEGYEKYSH